MHSLIIILYRNQKGEDDLEIPSLKSTNRLYEFLQKYIEYLPEEGQAEEVDPKQTHSSDKMRYDLKESDLNKSGGIKLKSLEKVADKLIQFRKDENLEELDIPVTLSPQNYIFF